MKVHVKELNSVQRRLELVFSQEEVSQAYERSSKKIQKRYPIKGFRPEKAPISIVRQHFGEHLTRDAFESLMDKNLPKALAEVQILPLGTPHLENGNILEYGKEYSCSLLVDIHPEITLDDGYKTIELKLNKAVITDDCVDRVIKNAAKRSAQYQETDEPAGKEDRVDVILSATSNDQVLFENTKIDCEVGSGEEPFGIPKFSHFIEGASKGETKTISLPSWSGRPLTKDHGNFLDKPIVFSIKIEKVLKMILPTINDDFAKDLEFESLEALKTFFREVQLPKQVEDWNSRFLDQGLGETLWNLYPFELPPVLVDMTIDRILDEQLGSIDEKMRYKMKTEPSIRDSIKPQAQKRVHYSLVLFAIAERENLSMEATPEDLKKNMSSDFESVEHLQKSLLLKKARDYLLDQAQVTYEEKPFLALVSNT
jgi:trigger factor